MFLQVHPHAKIYFEFRLDLLSLLIISYKAVPLIHYTYLVLQYAYCLHNINWK